MGQDHDYLRVTHLHAAAVVERDSLVTPLCSNDGLTFTGLTSENLTCMLGEIDVDNCVCYDPEDKKMVTSLPT